MSAALQIILVAIGLSYCIFNLALGVRRHFKGRGMSPGSLGASIPLLVVLFVQPWPMWLRLVLTPFVIGLEFMWVGVSLLLEQFFPAQRAKATVLCTNCGADWANGEFTQDCPQCGGFAMRTPCLLCGGRCGGIWYRSIHDSQDSNLAHWAGGCRLPIEEQRALLDKNSLAHENPE